MQGAYSGFVSVRWWLRVLLALDLLTVYWLCWTPRSVSICEQGQWWQVWTWCLPELPTWLGNVVLLVPTALLISLLFRNLSWQRIALVTCTISAVIELGQFMVPGRVPDLRDWLLNSLGSAAVARCLPGRRSTS